MWWKMGKNPLIEWEISPAFLYCGALMLLLLPARWLAALALAALFHELGHILALGILRIPIFRISLSLGGAKIYTEPLRGKKALISAAAGPVFSFLLMLFAEVFPELAICGLAQGCFNLLPFASSDGERILRSCCQWLFPRCWEYPVIAAKWLVMGCALVLGIRWIVGGSCDIWTVLLVLILVLRSGKENYLAKTARKRYNSLNYVLRGK